MKARFAALLVPAALAAALAGCGGGVPAGGVAKVGGVVITKQQFDHWLNAAARSSAQTGGAATVPDPPTYAHCIASLQSQPLPKGARKPTTSQLRTQCQQQYTALKQQVMQFLISSEWLQQEASKRHITVSDAQVRKEFDDQKKQSFPREKDYKSFLARTGFTESDLLFRIKQQLLATQVQQQVVKGKDTVTESQITSYYNNNKARFAQPERRDLLVVLSKTQGKAAAAKKAIQSGQPWGKVAKRYSIDEASKAQGGKLPGVAKGQQEKAFDQAIFGARKGQLVGPVKTQFGYYVFKVTAVHAASQQSLSNVKETIRALLKSQGEQQALNKFTTDFRKRFRDETVCAKGFKIASFCKNAPAAKTSGPVSGGAPAGGPTGGTPPSTAPSPTPTPAPTTPSPSGG